MSGLAERTAHTTDDQLLVFSERRLGVESSKLGQGVELRLGGVTGNDGRGGAFPRQPRASLEAAPSPPAVRPVVAASGRATSTVAARSNDSGTPAGAPRKKRSPVLWAFVGILGFFGLCVLVILIGVGILAYKVKTSPPPGLIVIGAAKQLPLGNPNFEVVNSDDGRNTVTFRDKKTGESVPINFDELKNGKIVFKSNRGPLTFTAGTKLPDWVPAYPGVTQQVKLTMESADGDAGVVTYSTKDLVKSVLSFYEQGLMQAGFR